MVFLQMPRDGSCATVDFVGSRPAITNETVASRTGVLVYIGGFGPLLL